MKTFEKTARTYIKREGLEELLAYLRETDFYTAPASTHFHGSAEGGLCLHSLNVATHLVKLADMYAPGKYSRETLTIVGLFHDLCKIGCYKVEYRNVKNEQGVWEKVPFYKFEEDFTFGGHGSKSLYIAMQHIKLTPEEAAAINSHMGFAGETNINSISSCYDNNLLAWMLHVADEASTYIEKL